MVEQLDKATTNFGIETSAEKIKIMTKNKSSKKEIKVKYLKMLQDSHI